MIYLTNTFTPIMAPHRPAKIRPMQEKEVRRRLAAGGWVSAISHQISADLLSAKFGSPVQFHRVNLDLVRGDQVIACCPLFRAEVAREYTMPELDAVK